MDHTAGVNASANREVSCMCRALQLAAPARRLQYERGTDGRTDRRKRMQPLPSLFDTALRLEYSPAFQFNARFNGGHPVVFQCRGIGFASITQQKSLK